MSRPYVSGLSDRALDKSILTVRSRENTSTIELLYHLNEIEHRKRYLRKGYGSMFDYCVCHLHYSASAASRRIRTARCLRRFPELDDMLRRCEVNLSTVSRVASLLDDPSGRKLLERIRHKSQRDVDRLVASLQPESAYRDQVRPVRVPVAPKPATTRPLPPPTAMTGAVPNVASPTTAAVAESTLSASTTPVGEPAPGATTAAVVSTEEKFVVRFLVDPAFMAKVERAKALLSGRLGNPTFEKVFGVLLDEFIERESPEGRRERRKRRQKKTEPRQKRRRDGGESPGKAGPVEPSPGESTRYIPAATRDAVYTRDGSRCTFVGDSGQRCRATRNLQIDHKVPFALGGSNELSNLRLLCAAHNMGEAERIYGKTKMERYSTAPP